MTTEFSTGREEYKHDDANYHQMVDSPIKEEESSCRYQNTEMEEYQLEQNLENDFEYIKDALEHDMEMIGRV